jgi:hypothetical protein
VFVDSEGAAGTVDADGTAPDDMVLQRWAPASQDNIGINTGTGGATRITYRGDGRTDMGVGASSNFDLVPTNCTADIRARRINVTSVGRAQFTKVNCP